MKSPKEVLFTWVKALNNHDAKAVAALYHDDAVNIQIAVGSPLKGKDAIYDDFVAFFESNPDTHTKLVNIFEDGEWGIIEWIGTGTYFRRGQADGKKYTINGCGFFQILAGKILFQRGYWDKATWYKQIGRSIDFDED